MKPARIKVRVKGWHRYDTIRGTTYRTLECAKTGDVLRVEPRPAPRGAVEFGFQGKVK